MSIYDDDNGDRVDGTELIELDEPGSDALLSGTTLEKIQEAIIERGGAPDDE